MSDISPFPPFDHRPFICAAWRVLKYYLRGLHHITITHPCPIPLAGPAILVCNHISGLDPVVLQSACPHLVTWMMAREYYDQPLGRWFFQRIGAIPVDRSGRDLAATRAAFRDLAAGHTLGIFPEGRIAPTPDLQPFQTGVALVAIKANVPVYPACIEGSMRNLDLLEAFLYPQRITIAFGPPVLFDRSNTSRPTINSATAAIHAAVLSLRPPPNALSPLTP
ncbi:MAG: lysophospholipid acyltransferase family protein [Planctomycetota bacterium]|nr:lysophospholipid acyltransferase family protein [Planctomycetota bacterium]